MATLNLINLVAIAIVLAYPLALSTIYKEVTAAYRAGQYVSVAAASLALFGTTAAWLLLMAITIDGIA